MFGTPSLQIDVEKNMSNKNMLCVDVTVTNPSYGAHVPVFMDGFVFLPHGYLSRVFGMEVVPFHTVAIKDCMRASASDYENWLTDLHASMCKFLED